MYTRIYMCITSVYRCICVHVYIYVCNICIPVYVRTHTGMRLRIHITAVVLHVKCDSHIIHTGKSKKKCICTRLEEKQYLVRVRKKPIYTAMVPAFDVPPEPIPRKHSLSLFSDIFVRVGMSQLAMRAPSRLWILVFFNTATAHCPQPGCLCIFWHFYMRKLHALSLLRRQVSVAPTLACRRCVSIFQSTVFCESFTRNARLDCAF